MFKRSKSMSMDESKALEILDMKTGVYHRLKEEKKREELLELLGKAMMEQSKQWMDGDRNRIRNEVEDVTVFSNAYHFIVQNCLDESKQKQEETLAMETEEIISAFSSMSLTESNTNLDQPISWKGGLSAEKGLLRSVSLKNRARPSINGSDQRRKSLQQQDFPELKAVAGIVKRNSIKRKGSKKKKSAPVNTDTSQP